VHKTRLVKHLFIYKVVKDFLTEMFCKTTVFSEQRFYNLLSCSRSLFSKCF
jgi:hypothetical protein